MYYGVYISGRQNYRWSINRKINGKIYHLGTLDTKSKAKKFQRKLKNICGNTRSIIVKKKVIRW